MFLFDVVNIGSLLAQTGPVDPSEFLACDNCPGSAFTAVGAAFSTLGYYAQAEWLHQIVSGGLKSWAMVAYLLAAIGLLISIAVGLPPKMYLWFAIGPGLFYWLVDDRVAVEGVAWRAGIVADDDEVGLRDMKEVWKRTEVGLINENYIIRNGFTISADAPPSGSSDACDDDGACVSTFFAMLDHVISDTIQQLVWILGVSRSRSGDGGERTNVFTDLGDFDIDNGLRMWDLTTNLKWEFIYSITSARVANNDVRQLFATFMASECGRKFVESIDKRNMTAAVYSRGATKDFSGFGSNASKSVLKQPDGQPSSSESSLYMGGAVSCGGGGALDNSFSGPKFLLVNLLEPESMPSPAALSRIVNQRDSFVGSVGAETGIANYSEVLVAKAEANPTDVADVRETINCRTFLTVVMQGLRWEAAHITYQMLRAAPMGMLPGAYAAQMLYGWDIKNEDDEQISVKDAPKFLENLILIHLFRNELQIAPSQIVEQRLTAAQKTIKSTEDFQRINGQASKYGELYTWALMVPYFQGKLLYFLAIAYPFAAMLIVVPGMHRVVLQWAQFWIWVKMWDLGFAMVTILERSVWAMTSNSLASGQLNSTVWEAAKLNPTCFEPNAFDTNMITTYVPEEVQVPVLMGDAMAGLIDKLLLLSNNIDLDMSNTYYIYIMSALYFAIPAVTGQLVLGAKSGAAGMISSAIGQIASPAGSAAGQAAAADLGAKMKMNQATGRQEAFASAMRAGGLAAQAIGKQNESTAENIFSSAANTKGSLYGTKAHLEDKAAGVMNSAQGVNRSLATLGGSVAGMPFDKIAGSGGKGGNAGAFSSLGANIGGYIVERDRHGMTIGYNQAGLAHTRAQIGQTEAGFNAQAKASIAGLQASRAESGASFKGEQAAWEAANNYAQANSDFAAAIGLGAGYLDAGQKPTNMQGMAMDGMLGAPAQAASRDLAYGNGSTVGGIYSSASTDVSGIAGDAIARTNNPDMAREPFGGSSYDGSTANAASALEAAGSYTKSLGVEGAVDKAASEEK